MENNRDIDIIEQYLTNELPEGERITFEERLQVEPNLVNEFERRQTAHKALDFMIAENLKEQLKSLEKEETKVISLHSRRRRMIYIISAAASVLLLIGAFAILLPGGSQPNELAEAYYELPDFSAQRSAEASEIQENKLYIGIEALENSAYDQAILTLDAIPESDENYIIAQYYLAHAYYLSSQFDQAEASFNEVSASNEIRYQEQAEWYALLACLMQKETNCDAQLNQIKNNANHAYQERATKIHQRLK